MHSGMVDGYGIPLGRFLTEANCHDFPLLAPTVTLADAVLSLWPEKQAVALREARTGRDPGGLQSRRAAAQRWSVPLECMALVVEPVAKTSLGG